MRRLMQAACTALMAIAIALILAPGNAVAQTALPPDFDVEDVKARIVDFIGDSSLYGLSRPPTADDIDMTRIVKIYVDTDVFSLGTDDFDEVVGILEQGLCVLNIDFAIEGVAFDVEVSKGLQPSEEDIERIRELGDEYAEGMIEQVLADVGKWKVNSIGHTTEPISSIYDLDIATKTSGITDREPIFVGSLPYFHYPVALYPDDEGKIGVMVPLSLGAVPWSALKMNRPSEFVALDYQEVKGVINSLPPEYSAEDDWPIDQGSTATDDPQASDSGPAFVPAKLSTGTRAIRALFIAIPVVALAAIAITVVRIVRRRRRATAAAAEASEAARAIEAGRTAGAVIKDSAAAAAAGAAHKAHAHGGEGSLSALARSDTALSSTPSQQDREEP
jgi:hypothetical protein